MPRRILQGTVVSNKNEKTVTVLVERRFTHPLMKKTVRMTKRYHAMTRPTRARWARPFASPSARRARNPKPGKS